MAAAMYASLLSVSSFDSNRFEPSYLTSISCGAPTPAIKPEGGGSNAERWSPDSWRAKAAAQAIEYPDPAALEDACLALRALPALVSPARIERAREQLRLVALGGAFVIQGGDCAESFHEVRHDLIGRKVTLLSEQANILSATLGLPVLRIGRIAGQYAKPRSSPYELLPDGSKVLAFRGHNVHSEFSNDRVPQPHRLLLGYFFAASTLNMVHQLGNGEWNRHTTEPSVEMPDAPHLGGLDELHTSHEALHLPYESALTRDEYNTSATFLWIGERTRQLDGAHIEYMRGLRNPIGVKVGPNADPAEVVALLDALSPNLSDRGRVTLITRLGARNVERALPPIIKAVQASGHLPVWMCDPCHGNTVCTANGTKTRCLEVMFEETIRTWKVHRQLGSHLGGLHLEQTGDDVTECIDGDRVRSSDVGLNYRSLCDPRLARHQALRLVRMFAETVAERLKLEQHLMDGIY